MMMPLTPPTADLSPETSRSSTPPKGRVDDAADWQRFFHAGAMPDPDLPRSSGPHDLQVSKSVDTEAPAEAGGHVTDPVDRFVSEDSAHLAPARPHGPLVTVGNDRMAPGKSVGISPTPPGAPHGAAVQRSVANGMTTADRARHNPEIGHQTEMRSGDAPALITIEPADDQFAALALSPAEAMISATIARSDSGLIATDDSAPLAAKPGLARALQGFTSTKQRIREELHLSDLSSAAGDESPFRHIPAEAGDNLAISSTPDTVSRINDPPVMAFRPEVPDTTPQRVMPETAAPTPIRSRLSADAKATTDPHVPIATAHLPSRVAPTILATLDEVTPTDRPAVPRGIDTSTARQQLPQGSSASLPVATNGSHATASMDLHVTRPVMDPFERPLLPPHSGPARMQYHDNMIGDTPAALASSADLAHEYRMSTRPIQDPVAPAQIPAATAEPAQSRTATQPPPDTGHSPPHRRRTLTAFSAPTAPQKLLAVDDQPADAAKTAQQDSRTGPLGGAVIPTTTTPRTETVSINATTTDLPVPWSHDRDPDDMLRDAHPTIPYAAVDVKAWLVHHREEVVPQGMTRQIGESSLPADMPAVLLTDPITKEATTAPLTRRSVGSAEIPAPDMTAMPGNANTTNRLSIHGSDAPSSDTVLASLPEQPMLTDPLLAPAMQPDSDHTAGGEVESSSPEMPADLLFAGVPALPAGSASPATSVAAGSIPPPARQIVTAVMTAGTDRVEMRLSPAHLGRLRLILAPDGDTIHVTIRAERSETLELLRRNTPELLAELRATGFADAGLSFGQTSDDEADAAPAAHEEGRAFVAHAPDSESVLHYHRAMVSGALDLRL